MRRFCTTSTASSLPFGHLASFRRRGETPLSEFYTKSMGRSVLTNRGISLVAHAGKAVLRIIALRIVARGLGSFFRVGADLAGRTVRIPAPKIDRRHNVRGPPTTGVATSEQCPTEHVLHRYVKDPRLCKPHALAVSASPIRSPGANGQGHPCVSLWHATSGTAA